MREGFVITEEFGIYVEGSEYAGEEFFVVTATNGYNLIMHIVRFVPDVEVDSIIEKTHRYVNRKIERVIEEGRFTVTETIDGDFVAIAAVGHDPDSLGMKMVECYKPEEGLEHARMRLERWINGHIKHMKLRNND